MSSFNLEHTKSSLLNIIPFWKRSPKAATYPNLPKPPNALSPEAKKRAEDLDITERRIADPVAASSNDKYIHGIDMWDFVKPGPSKEEQDLVAKIRAKCVRKERDETEIWNIFEADEEDEDEMVNLKAGFSKEEPATYRCFVAEYGTKEEVISEAYGLDRCFGAGDDPVNALKRLAHLICDMPR